jgi:hypothetical protein
VNCTALLLRAFLYISWKQLRATTSHRHEVSGPGDRDVRELAH